MARKLIQCSIFVTLVVGVGAFIYLKSASYTLHKADAIYAEVSHPEWSTRIQRDKAVLPNLGSGDHSMIYLVDIRRVSVPMGDAIDYYESESERLRLRECHIETYAEAKRKFDWNWKELGITPPSDDNILFITQSFTSNSTLRR